MSAPPPSGDRRRSPRLRCAIACVVRQGSSKETFRGELGDISLRGTLLKSARAAKPGDRLVVSFTLGAESFDDVPATVLWGRPAGAGYECGLAFPETWEGVIKKALLRPQARSILVVEDDAAVRTPLEGNLLSAGYQVLTADRLSAGLALFEQRPFDLVVVDLELPDGSGMQLLERIRSHPKRLRTPVLILTADARSESRLAGLAFGADQYLTKPVDYLEFLFFVSALLRRTRYNEEESGVISFERGMIDPKTHVARFGETDIDNLTAKEFDLLYRLIAARPRVLSKRYIMSNLWRTVLADNTIETHVKRLREKLGAAGGHRIVTVPGKGYKFI